MAYTNVPMEDTNGVGRVESMEELGVESMLDERGGEVVGMMVLEEEEGGVADMAMPKGGLAHRLPNWIVNMLRTNNWVDRGVDRGKKGLVGVLTTRSVVPKWVGRPFGYKVVDRI